MMSYALYRPATCRCLCHLPGFGWSSFGCCSCPCWYSGFAGNRPCCPLCRGVSDTYLNPLLGFGSYQGHTYLAALYPVWSSQPIGHCYTYQFGLYLCWFRLVCWY
jgi:hypothetical protein